MPVTDPIADAFTIIRNACLDRRETVEVAASGLKEKLLEILKNEGYIKNFRRLEDKRQGVLRVYLKYSGSGPVIKGIKRVSKPGLRIYAKKDKIPYVMNGLGIALVSTSQGVMTDKKARELKLGGEVLAYIW